MKIIVAFVVLASSVCAIAAPSFLTLPYNGDREIVAGWYYSCVEDNCSGDCSAQQGIDYDTGYLEPILAAHDGVAMTSQQAPESDYSFGIFVRIKDENGYETLYAHLDHAAPGISSYPEDQRNNNNFGEWTAVRRGDIIGYCGDTGTPSGNYHLHFAVETSYASGEKDPYGVYCTAGHYPGNGSGQDYMWATFPPVHASDVYSASWVDQTPNYPEGSDYVSVLAAQILHCTFTFRNNGATYWTNDRNSPNYVELQSVTGPGSPRPWREGLQCELAWNWIDPNHVGIGVLPVQTDPGSQGVFEFDIKAPLSPGDYYLYVAIYHAHSSGFISADGPTLHIKVTAPIHVPSEYSSIQSAIDAAFSGMTIDVSPGLYFENLSVTDKNITLRSANGPAGTIIDGSHGNPNNSQGVIFISNASCVVEGFTIQNNPNSGIECYGGAPTIRGCIIKNCNYAGINTEDNPAVIEKNIIRDCAGMGVNSHLGSPIIRNNLILNNTPTEGAALFYYGEPWDDVHPQIINNTVAFNDGIGIAINYSSPVPMSPLVSGNISSNNTGYGMSIYGEFPVEYNDVWGNGYANYQGYFSDAEPPPLDISLDPLFIGNIPFNFHLQSIGEGFSVNSPCINAGDPNPSFNDPDGSRNDLGVCGGPYAMQATPLADPLLDVARGFFAPRFVMDQQVTDNIDQGQSRQFDFWVWNLSDWGRILLHWLGSEMSMKIYGPDGTLYGQWQSSTPPLIVDLVAPDTGNWMAEITAVDVPHDAYPFAFVTGFMPLGSVSGIIANSTGHGLNGVTIDLYDSTGALLSTTSSTEAGSYHFPDLMPGTYEVSITAPLGYQPDAEIKLAIIDPGSESTVDFSVTPIRIIPAQKTRAYWKQQVSYVIKNIEDNRHRTEDYSAEQLCNFMDLIRSHFIENRVNPIPVFDASSATTQLDSLKVLRDILSVRCEYGNALERMRLKVKAQMTTLLLNVVAQRIAQFHPISQDSKNISQAITYTWRLFNSCSECQEEDEDVDGLQDERNCLCDCAKARRILAKINQDRSIRAGVIPGDVPYITYKPDGQETDLPTQFSLEQNYPNPFNAQTLISYSLPQPTHVRVDIYNILGQDVTTLMDASQEAGEHQVIWNAGDQPTGMYFYRIVTDDNVETKKMLLVK
jgi:hypothetical protein